MSVDIGLFLRNVQAAFANQQFQHAQFLLDYAVNLAKDNACPTTRLPLDVSIGLHRGRIRDANEDCILVVQGFRPCSQEAYGLFVVCDGMGGHNCGQEAAHLAIQTILECVLPLVESDATLFPWERLLENGIQQANRAIYLRNQSMEHQVVKGGAPVNTSQIHRMGTTVTAVLLFGEVAYVANVGDSRTYLYDQSLKKITKDHSLVAQFLADGILQEEDVYIHPQRNQITRALGVAPSVEVDMFVVPLQGNEIFLLCSDGLWEMTRDRKIEEVLSSSWANASSMADQLVQVANDGGGADNIGCVVVQLQPRTDVSSMETRLMEPVAGLNRLIHTS